MNDSLNFRCLKADEIDCRISTVKQTGITLLLYKDARVDQNILDETVGPMNWQRKHSRENANCTVSIWDEVKGQWIEKEDTGVESYTEKAKGLASDSFKRACFNWGIGRELYTAPFIWIKANDCEIKPKPDGKSYTCYDKFSVEKIEYDANKRISVLNIRNDSTKKTVYRIGQSTSIPEQLISESKLSELYCELARTGIGKKRICEKYKVDDLTYLTEIQCKDAIASLHKNPDRPPLEIPDDPEMPWNQVK